MLTLEPRGMGIQATGWVVDPDLGPLSTDPESEPAVRFVALLRREFGSSLAGPVHIFLRDEGYTAVAAFFRDEEACLSAIQRMGAESAELLDSSGELVVLSPEIRGSQESHHAG
ncbi:MAG: hypothetical protein HYZ53_21835 [Planctomycetes bacterium]|nr:hypothetical protein [Planctomycetota bacterium]